MVQFAEPADANGPKKKPSLSFFPLCFFICGHFSLLLIKIKGNDLSSLNNILNLGLYFLIKLASNSKASLSFEVVVTSSFLV